jgi:hypothetical protein
MDLCKKVSYKPAPNLEYWNGKLLGGGAGWVG